jgi:tape measure domain-containing protein
MSVTAAALSVSVDSRGVVRAVDALRQFGTEGKPAADAAAKIESSMSKVSSTAKNLDSETSRASSTIKRFGNDSTSTATAVDRASSSLSKAGSNARNAGSQVATAGSDAAGAARGFRESGDAADRSSTQLNKLATAAAGFTTFTGLKRAVTVVTEAFVDLYRASASAERIKIGLDFATAGHGAQEINYLRDVTKSLGLEFTSTAQAYMSFQAAAKGTSLEGQRAKTIFESVAKASAVMGLSAEQNSGVLLALQQMISKGTVQAEELRGQLGERLPGAFQIAAKAMGVTTAALGKMLEKGEVVANDFLPKFAAALNEHVGGAAEKAANRLDAATNRFMSAYERMKSEFGDTGISKFWAGQVAILNDAMEDVSNSIAKARSEGSGFAGQVLAATGAALRFINPLNGISYSAQDAGVKLKNAEAELASLAARGAQKSSNLMLRESYAHAERLVVKLREAKAAQDALDGVAPKNPADIQSNFPSRGESYARYAKQQSDSEKELLEIRQRASGVNQQYTKDLEALQKAKKLGTISDAAYTEEVTALAQRTWKSSAAGQEEARLKAEAERARKAGLRGAGREEKIGDRVEAQQAKQALDQQKEMIDQEASLYQSRTDILTKYRSADLISEQDYVAAKKVARDDYIAALQSANEAEVAILQAQKSSTKDPAKKAEVDTELARKNIELAKAIRSVNTEAAREETDLFFARLQRVKTATEANLSPLERMQLELKKLNDLLADGLGQGTYDKLAKDIKKAYEKGIYDAKKEVDGFVDYAGYAGEEINSFIGSGLTSIMSGKYSELGADFGKMIESMVLKAATAQLMNALWGSGGLGTGSSGLGNGFASMAVDFVGGLFRADGGDTAKGKRYRVGERGDELFTGSDGNRYLIPGQNGYITSNERLTQEALAGSNVSAGGATVVQAPAVQVNVINQTSQKVQAEQRTRTGSDNSQIIEIVLKEVASDIRSGGQVADAMQGQYGLNRSAGIR